MNGFALLMALALAGADDERVDYSVRTTEDDQVEYTIQIPPSIARLVADGEEIHSPVPAEAGQVQRLCIRIGKTPVSHNVASMETFRRLMAQATGRMHGAVGQVPEGAQATIVWPAAGPPRNATGVTWGWQPDRDGKLAYYLQIEPAVLKALQEGDEIHAMIDAAAGSMATFVVLAGNRALPKVPAVTGIGQSAASSNPSPIGKTQTVAPRGGLTPLGTPPPSAPPGQLPPTDRDLASQFGAGTGATSQPNTPPSSIRDGQFGLPRDTRMEQPSTAPSLYRDSSGNPASQYSSMEDQRYADERYADQRLTDQRYAPGYGQRDSAAGGFAGASQQPAAPPAGTDYNNYGPASSEPNRTAFQPPDTSRAGYPSAEHATVPHTASLPPQAAAPTAASTDSAIPPTATTAPAATAGNGGSLIWLLLMFSLFLSIGVNLYLGWTTAEYYNRYRTAVDRLRSASRGT